MPKGVNQIISHTLKQKSIAGFDTSQTIPLGMDELQAHTNPTFQPFSIEDDGNSSKDSSLALKESLSSHAEAKSSETIVMLVMVTQIINFGGRTTKHEHWKDSLKRMQKRTLNSTIKMNKSIT